MPKAYSYSSLEMFRTCPRQYKFKVIDNAPKEEGVYANLYLGNAVHKVLQKLYQSGFDGVVIPWKETEKLYYDEWNKLDKDVVQVKSAFQTVDDSIRIGKEILKKYYDKFNPFNDGTLIDTEKQIHFDLPGSDFRFQCRIDRLTKKDDGTLEVWDYKTGQHLVTPKDHSFIFQMGLYQMAVMSQYTNYKKIELIVYSLRHEEPVRYEMSPEELDELNFSLRNIVNEIINAKKLNDFKTNEGNHCSWCDYYKLCPVKRHKLMLEETEETENLEYTPGQLRELADEYIIEHQKSITLKESLEAKKEKLKDIARKTDLRAFCGEKGDVKISLNQKEDFVSKSKNQEEYAKFESVCRSLDLYDLFIPDSKEILKEYRKGLLSDDKYKQLEEYILQSETSRIYVKLKHQSSEDDHIV